MTPILLHHMGSGLTTTQVCGNIIIFYIYTLQCPDMILIYSALIFHIIQSFKILFRYILQRQQELKEDMTAGKTRDALMKVFYQKVFCRYN